MLDNKKTREKKHKNQNLDLTKDINDSPSQNCEKKSNKIKVDKESDKRKIHFREINNKNGEIEEKGNKKQNKISEGEIREYKEKENLKKRNEKNGYNESSIIKNEIKAKNKKKLISDSYTEEEGKQKIISINKYKSKENISVDLPSKFNSNYNKNIKRKKEDLLPLEESSESFYLSKYKNSENNYKRKKEKYNPSNEIQNKRDDISFLDEDKNRKGNLFVISNENNKGEIYNFKIGTSNSSFLFRKSRSLKINHCINGFFYERIKTKNYSNLKEAKEKSNSMNSGNKANKKEIIIKFINNAIIIKLLLIINLFQTLQNEERHLLKVNYIPNITLKIKGIGNNHILGQEFDKNNYPNITIINGIKENEVKYSYDFNKTENIVEFGMMQ